MNIFYIEKDPVECARAHFDSHVVKMTLETAQLLSSIHRMYRNAEDCNREGIYRLTHQNHPCTQWLRVSSQNYDWGVRLFRALLDEYKFRFNKSHACGALLDVLSKNPILEHEQQYQRNWGHLPSFTLRPETSSHTRFTQPNLAMPIQYKMDEQKKNIVVSTEMRPASSLFSYRNYYANGKIKLAKYKNRQAPKWLWEYNPNLIVQDVNGSVQGYNSDGTPRLIGDGIALNSRRW